MLGRLLRYDLRSMYKKFAILWPAVLVVAFLNQMVVWGAEKASFFLELGGLEFLFELAPAVVYFGLMVALVVVSMFYVVLRFYQGLLGDEGYLMHTLPVKPWQLVASKLLTATMTVIVSGLVGILSIAILVEDGNIFRAVGDLLPRFRGFTDFIAFLEFFALMVFMLWGSITKIYAACAIGQLSNKNRALCSVGAYIGLNTIQSVLTIGGFFFLGHLDRATGFLQRGLRVLERVLEAMLRSPMGQAIIGDGAALVFHGVMGCFCLFYLVKTAILFFITTYILQRKLNLQ